MDRITCVVIYICTAVGIMIIPIFILSAHVLNSTSFECVTFQRMFDPKKMK